MTSRKRKFKKIATDKQTWQEILLKPLSLMENIQHFLENLM